MNATIPLDTPGLPLRHRPARPPLDPVRKQAARELTHADPHLPEGDPSQTAGPYVHIGLIPHQAGFDIFENNFSSLAAPKRRASGSHRGPRPRRHGAPPGHPGGDLAGQRGRPVQPPGRPAGQAARPDSAAGAAPGPISRPASTRFETIKPGRVAGRHGRKAMAPHVNFWIVARGINIGLSTRMYFPDEAEANAEDPVLNIVDPPERRSTLIAQRQERGEVGRLHLRHPPPGRTRDGLLRHLRTQEVYCD